MCEIEMNSMKIMVINGPGTALLGRDDVKNSGNDTLDDIDLRIRERAEDYDMDVVFVRTNLEGEIVEALYRALDTCDGVVLNAGAYTYYSYVIAEAVGAIGIPVIEVRVDNDISGAVSVVCPKCAGRITGLGTAVYTLALEALSEM